MQNKDENKRWRYEKTYIYIFITVLSVLLNIFFLYDRFHEGVVSKPVHYEYLAYVRKNNELYATSYTYTEVMKITDKGCEKTEESVDMNTELCKTSVSFGKDTVQIRTQYLYDNDPRIGFTSDYGYNAEIKTASLEDFVPVSVAVK